MANKDKVINKNVELKKLKGDMTIMEYTRFNEHYKHMDKKNCFFVRHNFHGTKADIIRDKKRIIIQVEKVKVGDTLQRIFDFPPQLKKITLVNDKLIKALKLRGMLEFTIFRKTKSHIVLDDKSKRDLKDIFAQIEQTIPRSTEPTRKTRTLFEEKRYQTTSKAMGLVERVQESVSVHSEVSASMEDTMDNARKGKVDIRDIKNHIERISKNKSSDAIMAIGSLKDFDKIYSHCIEVAAIFCLTYFEIVKQKRRKSVFDSESNAMLGAFLHDFGKSKVPKELLESEEMFQKNGRENQIIRSHPLFGAELLAGMNMPDYIVNMAQYHHVKADTNMLSSYPNEANYKKVVLETRVLSIVDTYQALVGKREYKRSWSPPATIRYLDALAGLEYDLRIWDIFMHTIGIYPKGSLVKLNDGSLAFVMSIPPKGENLARPLVVVVQNADGEDLKHHTLFDLQVERDIRIVEDMDIKAVFGDKALDVFTRISV